MFEQTTAVKCRKESQYTDYQGLAEFQALTLRVNCDEKKFDT